MTATRILRVATLAVGGVVWALAGALLWQTRVPDDLRLPSLNERSIFGAGLVHQAERYERFFNLSWILGTVAALAALAWMVRRGHADRRLGGIASVRARDRVVAAPARNLDGELRVCARNGVGRPPGDDPGRLRRTRGTAPAGEKGRRLVVARGDAPARHALRGAATFVSVRP